jgi:hypothetical protein
LDFIEAKIFTMKVTNMMEMAQRTKPELKNSYDFAMSSFARMHGVKYVQSNDSVHRFCILWAESNLEPPLDSLTKVDFYFRDLWISSTLK